MQTNSFNLHFLLHSAHLIEEQLRLKLTKIEVSQSQARVIDALSRLGAVSQVTLAREFSITPASMSTMTKRLIEAGYITRKVDPDQARRNIVALTPQGQDLVTKVHAAWREIDIVITDAMGTQDASDLFTLTRRLRDRLGGKAPGSKPKNTIQTSNQDKSL